MRFDSQRPAVGPYVVDSIEEGNMYKLKEQATGNEHPVLVPEDSLETLDTD